jgi:hypothetical protein
MYSARPNNDQEKETFFGDKTTREREGKRERKKERAFLEVGLSTLNNFRASHFSPR